MSADKRGICKKPAKYDPDATPPPIIIHEDEETNIKYCGAVKWRYDPNTKKCIHYAAQKYKWDMQKGSGFKI